MSRLPALTALALIAAGPAFAAQSYVLDKIEVNGLKSVSQDSVTGKLPFQPGAKVTVPDIIADQDALTKALEDVHVTGGVKTSMRNHGNGHVDAIFTVNDTGIQAPVKTTIAPKLKAELFVGNAKLSADQLMAASGLTVGQDLDDKKIQDAQAAISAAYKQAKVDRKSVV